MISFNVLTEPWIPVLGPTRDPNDRGLLDVLTSAHELGEIRDPSPMIEFGLYRLLIAFVMDALDLTKLEDLESLLHAGRFDAKALNAYASRWADRFDLFDTERPFLQSPGRLPATVPKKNMSAATYLMPQIPSGTNVIHFHRELEYDAAFAPAVCARALTAIAPFTTQGGQGKSPSINGAPPWYVLVRGGSLFETIVLNVCAMPIAGLTGTEGPAWRATRPMVAKQEVRDYSLLEGLTWRPRDVRLLPETTGGTCSYSGCAHDVLVRRIIFKAGFKAAQDAGLWRDPQASYRILPPKKSAKTAKATISPLRPQRGRHLWRDIGPIALLDGTDNIASAARYERPLITSQFARMQQERMLPVDQDLRLTCYGVCTDQAKVLSWQREHLAVPAEVLRHPLGGVQVQDALELAREIERAVSRAVRLAYPDRGDTVTRSLADESARRFWDELRGSFNVVVMDGVQAQSPTDVDAPAALAQAWFDVLRTHADHILNDTIEHLDSDADAIRRQVEARRSLHNRLRRLRPGADQEAAGVAATGGAT